MPRKRARTQHKDQENGYVTSKVFPDSFLQSDLLGWKHKTNSFFNLPGLFVGIISFKGSESSSAVNPTSPLGINEFSNSGHPCRSQKPSCEGHLKSWDSKKVGLSIIDSLDDELEQSEKVLRSSYSKNILFAHHTQVETPDIRPHIEHFEASFKSLPKPEAKLSYGGAKTNKSSGVLFEIGGPSESKPLGKNLSCSLDSGRSVLRTIRSGIPAKEIGPFLMNPSSCFPKGSVSGSSMQKKPTLFPIFTGNGEAFTGTLSASEIELSEDYTSVRSHGSNPKTTHFWGDCILECHDNGFTILPKNKERSILLPQVPLYSEALAPYSSKSFLSFCYSCKKKLDGKDIYMYRGEKAFCSGSCRSQQMSIDEALEEDNNDSSKDSIRSDYCETVF